ncbi:hypothetical protein [Phytoactinopolyspora halotolerans]|uniref:EfeO-type cupredoxin-like domain-containing protein n=1 Tax=Phytoactinopolyspora halotolerans TaxID=1981512 RepID=A0A6L9S9G0_9ACTN|nr:hypothetical protein [Phytoactinopolyspora halotolerans]NEE02015.1 hypothetical protein [Phytoactinopolyspora halotolerans]
MRRLGRPGRLVVAVLVCVLAGWTGSGCGAAQDEAPAAPSQQSSTPSSDIRIGLTEWSIHTGGAIARPGEVELVVTNAGGTVHDLVVEGEQGTWRTPMIEPGGRETLVIEAAAGEQLVLDCSVPGHHENGMHGTLDVAE